jgi:hypothetical protein
MITIGATIVGVVGWLYRKRSEDRREIILVKRLFEEVDDIYSRFKMNSIQCESELIRLRSEVLKEFKDGVMDEENYKTLDARKLNNLMKSLSSIRLIISVRFLIGKRILN